MIPVCSERDPSSYSTPENATTTHFVLDWNINFPEKIITGSIVLHLNIKNSSYKQLILDTRDLKISRIICEDSGQALNFELGKYDKNFGSKLTISLPADLISNVVSVRVCYSTSPSSSGLQWLTPNQTSGKQHPFLFSQCQPIHVRSLMPCQDTPQVKATYSATVKCDANLVALMSALGADTPSSSSTPADSDGMKTFKFRQPVPIPSYLLAIVVGDLVSEVIGPRSKVWAEKEVIERAAYEFAETEKMLTIAESLCGTYVWGQYDLMVLPPSFPYGGMENPCLTFVTPTLLAGNRSLADVIAHEICHSWTGNLVTNCNWEHFWLNEGFTVFIERKIQGRMRGKAARDMSAIEGWENLKQCIDTRGKSNPLTCLVPRLHDTDPDDAFSVVPYEKGHTLLWYLESILGGPEEFEPFLKAYLAKFSHQALATETFLAFLNTYFSSKAQVLKTVDWEAWFSTPGMPPYQPQFDTTLIDECLQLCASWRDWQGGDDCPFKPDDLKQLSNNQVIVWLLKVLEVELSLEKVRKMDEIYEMGKYSNYEIRCLWLRLCIKVRWTDKLDECLTFVNSTGRMKFCRPIYRDLYQWEDARKKTIANFLAQKVNMMHVSVHTLTKDLHLNDEKDS